MLLSRRHFIRTGATGVALGLAAPALAKVGGGNSFDAPLLQRALAALNKHGAAVPQKDRIGIVDFSLPSHARRLFLVDLDSRHYTAHYVCHGRGSDPAHTGWLKRFSNENGSYASCDGAFVTGAHYSGKHGQSMRLEGLDSTNCNAMSRAIVVHTSWYAEPEMIEQHGMLGRSEGCFTVPSASLDEVLTRLGPGRMLYADKI